MSARARYYVETVGPETGPAFVMSTEVFSEAADRADQEVARANGRRVSVYAIAGTEVLTVHDWARARSSDLAPLEALMPVEPAGAPAELEAEVDDDDVELELEDEPRCPNCLLPHASRSEALACCQEDTPALPEPWWANR